MESIAPRVVTAPRYDAPLSPNGSAPKESTGFFASIKGWFGRAFNAVKSFASRAFGAVKGFIARVTDRIPQTVRRLGKPFTLAPLVVPKVWDFFGKITTWLWNHGPRQINNFLGKYVRRPIQDWVNSKSRNPFVRLIPSFVEGAVLFITQRVLRGMGPWGVAAYIAITLVFTDLMKYASDFTDDNPVGQNIMAGASLGTIGAMFVAAVLGKNWSVLKAVEVLTMRVAPIGGYVQQVWLDVTEQDDDEKDAPATAETTDESEQAEEVTPEEMGERVAETLREDPAASVTLVQSKVNVNPKGRREVWTVKGHDVDVDQVGGFYWKDGVGYDRTGQPVAVDLRGDLTRTTRDRRRKQFTEEWVAIHPLSA